MNYLYSKLGFSKFYSLIFGIVSAIAGILFVPSGSGDGWENLWIYTGSASMITAYSLSEIFIEKRNNFSNKRLTIIAIMVGIISHWLFWYEALLINYIKWKFYSMSFLGTPYNPITGIYGALLNSIISLLFFGWIAIPVSVSIIFLSKHLYRK